MGKKVKARVKNMQKAQQREPAAASSNAGSGDAASHDAINSTGEATVSASGREQCGHYTRGSAHLDKVLLEIMSSKHVASCEHCREDAPRKKGSNKQQKKKGGGPKGATSKAQAKVEKSDMWVCLDCGRHFCGGAVAETKPYGHARRHAKQDRHWWAARFDDPTVAYCLHCENEVSIEMPRVEKVVEVAADDKAVSVVDSNGLVLANCNVNVIRGLPNLGNTCFFNAVLQSLLSLDRLRKKMLGPDVPSGPLAMSLKKLFVETSASNDTGGALSPKNLFSSICTKSPQFRGYQMQDSHELLRCFLDGLHTEETEARKLVEDASNARVPTLVVSIFGGQLSSTVSSTECTHSSVKHDQFLDLSLPVPSRRPPAKSVSSSPAKRTKQSIRDRNKSRRYAKIVTRASPAIEECSKEKVQTVAECNGSQVPCSELGQVVSEKDLEPSECSESCASVPNQELKATSNVEDSMCWLDYVSDAEGAKSEILDSADSTEARQIWGRKDDALPKVILSSEHSGENSGENIIDDAASVPPVILLPYKEFSTTVEELDGTAENLHNSDDAAPYPALSPVTENNAQPAYGGDEEQDEYVGLGDMFNEPEVTSEVKGGTGTAEDIDVMAWSSNSADDEVDDSNAPISVDGCLALYTEPEQLSEPWHCEHCSNAAAHPNTNEEKDGDKMIASANEKKDGSEMMASGDERQDGDKIIVSCSKKETIDQIMATEGCSNNLSPDMRCKDRVCASPSLADGENTSDGNLLDSGNAMFTVDKNEQSDSKTYCQESKGLNSSSLEHTSSSKQQHDSVQLNDRHNVDVAAETTNVPLSCGDDSASCSTNSDKKAECSAGVEEVLTNSLPSETQSILPSTKDSEDAMTRNHSRRKRMKMLGKVHQGHDNQIKQKENDTKVFRAAMRRILISKAPPVLTINLNRFSHDSNGRLKKLKGHVRFKEMLDVRPFMDPRYTQLKHISNTASDFLEKKRHVVSEIDGDDTIHDVVCIVSFKLF